MQINRPKRILVEDFSDENKEVAEKIGYVINNFNEEIYNLVSGNLDVDNLRQKIVSINVTVNASGIPTQRTQFRTGLGNQINGIQCIRAENLTNSTTYPTSAPFITFTINNEIVTISHVTGLNTNNKYKLTLLLIG